MTEGGREEEGWGTKYWNETISIQLGFRHIFCFLFLGILIGMGIKTGRFLIEIICIEVFSFFVN